ncbi:2-amino-4-hydroxy-6-hydroxymethyldihydropteridine diphosphokinase [Tahibacter aquaticus]|uniref:2-amino-4-hydroxy-6-hydroxymethyldihydropteridine pyrophosphokinase n=1 Tax=Tahibacter aquaticus TaxID=520092 RepID=A0A4R6YWT0_9GAMM|nr:2-amino-4-hydroxy-6-hydroxymethyldihydropteridine diphosphokinase [Tahibacter aquaticus]TDR43293.1 2-amino-4-hydroxy-6-hydroxymethyldihydropteridine diphosphokinase [Tahibacter aquaticus]
MITAFIGLGSNLGDSRRSVDQAAQRIAGLASTQLRQVSSQYLTPPWGVQQQPPFINAVVEISTSLGAPALLAGLLEIEREAGRVRDGSRWGPRPLDLDVLLYGQQIISRPGLCVPHPHLAERAFVLLPLAEIAPLQQVPGLGRVADLLARIDFSACTRLPPLLCDEERVA